MTFALAWRTTSSTATYSSFMLKAKFYLTQRELHIMEKVNLHGNFHRFWNRTRTSTILRRMCILSTRRLNLSNEKKNLFWTFPRYFENGRGRTFCEHGFQFHKHFNVKLLWNGILNNKNIQVRTVLLHTPIPWEERPYPFPNTLIWSMNFNSQQRKSYQSRRSLWSMYSFMFIDILVGPKRQMKDTLKVMQ